MGHQGCRETIPRATTPCSETRLSTDRNERWVTEKVRLFVSNSISLKRMHFSWFCLRKQFDGSTHTFWAYVCVLFTSVYVRTLRIFKKKKVRTFQWTKDIFFRNQGPVWKVKTIVGTGDILEKLKRFVKSRHDLFLKWGDFRNILTTFKVLFDS